MEVGIAELVKHVTKLVERAEHGEEIIVKRHGKAVAKLTGIEQPKAKREFGVLKDTVTLYDGWDQDLPLGLWEALRESETGSRLKTKKRGA
jgi:prevent-host-death family protein